MIEIRTEHPLAADSLDHLYPHGTAFDNSVLYAFNAKIYECWPNATLLDIGCAGGGLVKSFLDDGHLAVGIEGSDYSRNHGRAEWATIPDNLFTADATKPFAVYEDHKQLKFDVVTAWEVLEHIPARRLRQFFANVQTHLKPTGVFICSVCLISAGLSEHGIEHHITLKPWDWWENQFRRVGFVKDQEMGEYIDPDWVRGPGTGVVGSICSVFRVQ